MRMLWLSEECAFSLLELEYHNGERACNTHSDIVVTQ